MLTFPAPQKLLRMRLGRPDSDTSVFFISGLNNKLATLTLVAFCLTTSSLALAEQSSAIAISVGEFDAFDDAVSEVGIEYRAAPLESMYDLIPAVGLAANSDDAYWLYGGVRYDFQFSGSWVLTPHIAVALYEDNGAKKMGSTFQFRSGLEVAYKFSESSRLGVGVNHLSNGSFADENPGADSLVISYSFAL
ncbi:acyloxyacyl hydrolase [Amphritea sp. HPY]|uniref:acyloxyacyl hydrolase n=1 Tax=Amphritea sp. HPY TaxID=3421652 RepID=UPI003D7D14C0